MQMCDANNNFVLPTAVVAIQATTVLAVIFSFLACALGFSGGRDAGGYGAAVSSLVGMIFTICAFSLWCTWNLSQQYRSQQGYVVPLWTNTPGVLQPSQAASMWFGASFVLEVMAFLTLLVATCTFFAVASQQRSRYEAGDFGSGA
jgi:hypothetical protein